MGKEKYQAKIFGRHFFMQKKKSYSTIKLSDISGQWATTTKPSYIYDVLEDGQVQVTIRINDDDTAYLWSGVKYHGNKYSEIVSVFKSQGIIKKNNKVIGYAIYKDFSWHNVDPGNSLFSSGDSIMIIVKAGRSQGKLSKKLNKNNKKVK